MEYLPLFLLMMAVLIAAWFYLQRAKARDAGATTTTESSEAAEPVETHAETPPAERPPQ